MSFNPLITVVETYETSGDLKLIHEILKLPSAKEGVEFQRNIVKEFQFTQWTTLYTTDADNEIDVKYPDSANVNSPFFETSTNSLKVLNVK